MAIITAKFCFKNSQRQSNVSQFSQFKLSYLTDSKSNSYYSALERATYLKGGFNLYIEKHVSRVAYEERRGTHSDAPAWMRSGGLQAADWAVITEYQRCLEPLKITTKRLEGRGKHHSSNFGAIYEVLPVFEYLLDQLEKLAEPYADVVFDAHEEAPEDHLHINLRNAWVKAEEYYRKLDDSPVYYAATCHNPYYKYYCENSWEHKDGWLRTANAGFKSCGGYTRRRRRVLHHNQLVQARSTT